MMKFQLGRLVITPAVLKVLEVDDICWAIDRHVCGEWGDADYQANETALLSGERLLSVYRIPNGFELRVLTTTDRLTSTVYTLEDSVQ